MSLTRVKNITDKTTVRSTLTVDNSDTGYFAANFNEINNDNVAFRISQNREGQNVALAMGSVGSSLYTGIQSYNNTALTDEDLVLQPLGGYVLKPNQPMFKASITTNTGRATTNTQAITPYDTTQLNVGNHYNTSTYKFTAPIAGNYFFSISQNKVGKLIIYIAKNGSNFHAGEFLHDTAGNWDHCTISCVVPLAANDTVEAQCKLNNNNSAQYAWNGGSTLWDSFSGFLIG